MFSNICFLIIFLSTVAQCRQICYDGYGCFIDTTPFGGTKQRPLAFLPDTPAKISTSFTLYNRKTRNGQKVNSTFTGNYDPLLPTKFIVHGFFHHGAKDYILNMKDALIKIADVNVIVTDWSKGNGLPYTQATANTQIVGADISILINSIISSKKVSAESFHCIGHSLGSHICGYAGQRVSGLGQITGLDPAGPYFEYTDPIVRLDVTDAKFVDILHSDGENNLQLGFGLIQSIGHVDYFPNGGLDQPNCPKTTNKIITSILSALTLDIDKIEKEVACSHMAAVQFYTDSIESSCKYTAYPCTSKDDFDNGKCITCKSAEGCNRMGYFTSQTRDKGDLYLNTQSPLSKPYCKQNYRLYLLSTSSLTQARGKFEIFFQTKDQVTPTIVLDDDSVTFKKGSEFNKFISLDAPLESLEITNVFIRYTISRSITAPWLYESKWAFDNVELFIGENQTKLRFCQATQFIQSGHTVIFNKC